MTSLSNALKLNVGIMYDLSGDEASCVLWSFMMMFTVMSSSYIIFPLGEAAAMKAGAEIVPFFSIAAVFLTLSVSPFYAAFVARTHSAALVPPLQISSHHFTAMHPFHLIWQQPIDYLTLLLPNPNHNHNNNNNEIRCLD